MFKKEEDVKESEITFTVEETRFVNIPEDDIKLEVTEIQGKLNNSKFLNIKKRIQNRVVTGEYFNCNLRRVPRGRLKFFC